MSGLIKLLTGILGILAVIACLATIGIIGYSVIDQGGKKNTNTANVQNTAPLNQGEKENQEQAAVPTQIPKGQGEETGTIANLEGHVHDYEESIEVKATCYSAGRLKYTCECGDSYYVDVSSTGHVADDWEVIRKPTEDREGLREKRCIYCDEIIAQETIEYDSEEGSGEGSGEKHTHEYTANIEREPTCTLAGLRKYTCSCGSFYTQTISALGHIAADWTTVEEPTTSAMGRQQRTCTVCGVILDSRPVNMISPSPSPSPSAAASASASATASGASPSASAGATNTPSSAATPGATPTAVPTPTPHTHNYNSYVLKQPNCEEKGIRSFVCSCGSSYAEEIEKDPNNHSYRSTIIPPTKTTQGYTIYRCIRCNFSYNDNYTPALGN